MTAHAVVTAHIGGLPVEEVLMTVVPAAGALWVAITARTRRRPARRRGKSRTVERIR